MSTPSKISVELTGPQRRMLKQLLHTGIHPAVMRRRAAILLKADSKGPDAWTDRAIADALDITTMTVQRVRQQFAREGLDATLHRKRPTGRQYHKLDSKAQGILASLTRSKAPGQRGHWTMRQLADKLVEMNVVDAIDPATICRTLKKINSHSNAADRP